MKHNTTIVATNKKKENLMTKQTFDLIMFTAFFGCILLAIYTNSLPESDRKDGLMLILPIIMLLIFVTTIAWMPLYSHMK